MNRQARIDLPGYAYHAYSRGQRGNPLFFSYHDYAEFKKIVLNALEKFDFEIIAYCLMKNHYHFLVIRNSDPLSKIFHYINTTYALYLNKTYDLVGHVFQYRFNSKIILNQRYYVTAVNYIHENAFRAGLVKQGKIYKYSSEGYYMNNEEDELITKPIKNFAVKKIDEDIFKHAQFIGTEQDLNVSKIFEDNIESVFVKKDNPDQVVYKIIDKIKIMLKKKSINIEEIMGKRSSRSMENIKKKIIQTLYYKYGFPVIYIAKAFDVSSSNIYKKIEK